MQEHDTDMYFYAEDETCASPDALSLDKWIEQNSVAACVEYGSDICTAIREVVENV